MASAFLRQTSRLIGTAPVPVGGYTAPAATKVTVIGLTCANLTSSQVTVTVTHRDSALVNTTIVANAPIPAGSSLSVISESFKLILQPGDSVLVTAGVAASVDAIMSVVELT